MYIYIVNDPVMQQERITFFFSKYYDNPGRWGSGIGTRLFLLENLLLSCSFVGGKID